MDLEQAQKLALETDYAIEAVGEEINTADAAAFFLEGYEYAQRQVKTNCDLPVVSNCKNYTREDVIKILCNALKATGNEIKATMKDIRTRPHIVFEGKDLDKWIEANV